MVQRSACGQDPSTHTKDNEDGTTSHNTTGGHLPGPLLTVIDILTGTVTSTTTGTTGTDILKLPPIEATCPCPFSARTAYEGGWLLPLYWNDKITYAINMPRVKQWLCEHGPLTGGVPWPACGCQQSKAEPTCLTPCCW